MGDCPYGSARHRTRTGKIGMHYHVQKRAKLQGRRFQSSPLTGLSRVVYRPGKPFRVGADRKGYRLCQRGAHLDHAGPGGSDVDRHLRQSSAARDPLVAAAVPVIERDLFATKKSLDLGNIAPEILARRRALTNLRERGITAANSEHRASPGLRL